uniref:site-specific DNA-methyltransferase (adenine-specific) n=1 Tax=Candidatus Methanophagaceae archaeon ANME-1 ERB6 TaxID=2759912 RepID=A0A7G9YVS8_9EURY|nr:hypothetical protein GAKKPHMA_00018 [Methanosarcinales archaeon ANME-1 ERB6]
MNSTNIVDTLLKDIKERLTLDGKNRVFNEGKGLRSEFMNEEAEPEAFTREFLIDKIFSALELEKLPEKKIEDSRGLRSVDYRIKSKERMFLVEAKSLNADLFEKSREGGVNQIKGLFKLAEVQKKYDFGVATNGLRWVFIDRTGKIVDDLRLEADFAQIKEFLVGKEKVVSPKTEEEISKKFYDWYNALLHGGRYKNHENKQKTVAEDDCLVSNIIGVKDLEEREQIAQVVMNRLIFIKFLQSKGIIGEDILRFLAETKEDMLTPKLRQLFFGTLDRPVDDRFDIDERFKDIPYLNGSLFVHTEVERKNIDYKVRADILKEVIAFLDSFKFVHKEQFENEDSIDPEILGYIFERAMTARDRKGTGAYYTPKSITKYISENTIYPCIIEKTNEILKTEKGYKDTELIKDIDELFILPATTLKEIWDKTILKLRVLDNACGSGAFLLAAANILFELNKKINDKLGAENLDTTLKILILVNNLYGVDINPNGIEIAKLRLWLWLADSYEPGYIKPLPNIDYNLRVGNSLIGYVDLGEFKGAKLTISDFLHDEEKPTLDSLLKERNDLIREYKITWGEEAKELKGKVQELDGTISNLLNAELYRKFQKKKIKISREEFLRLNPFHWGFEFYEVFAFDKPLEERGFDVVLGNPPYVKARDSKDKQLRSYLQSCGRFRSLYKMWDVYIPFVELGIGLLKKDGRFSMIIPDTIGVADYTEKVVEIILKEYTIYQIDFFPNIKVFVGVGIGNKIIFIKNSKHHTKCKKIKHINKIENIEVVDIVEIPDDSTFKLESRRISINTEDTLPLGQICYVSYGLRLNSDKNDPRGSFKKSDLLSRTSDTIHSKLYTEGKYLDRYRIKNEIYLEWGTDRCPKRLVRPTFSELYPPEKLLMSRQKGIVTLCTQGHICDNTIILGVPYRDLKGVENKSITKYIKNIRMDRVELERISMDFDLKYLLTVLNSKLISYYLKFAKRAKIDIYPDDWKNIPIKNIPVSSQHRFIYPCNYILFLNETEERRKTEKELIEFIDKHVIDSLVYELYFKDKFEEDGLKTNLLGLVEPYLEDIEGLKSGDEKLKVIKEVVEKIKGDKKVEMEIEKIKGHEWVKEIES